jgi:hypothetical protein
MLKVRHLDVLLTPAKGSDNKHLWELFSFFWGGGGVNLIWICLSSHVGTLVLST